MSVAANAGDLGDPASGTPALCRLCAQDSDRLLPVFNTEGHDLKLADKIHSYLPIKVNAEDTLPLQVCYQCAGTLLSWHYLYQNCIEANNILTSRLNKIQSGPSSPSKDLDNNDKTEKDADDSKKRLAHCDSFRHLHVQTARRHFQLMIPSCDGINAFKDFDESRSINEIFNENYADPNLGSEKRLLLLQNLIVKLRSHIKKYHSKVETEEDEPLANLVTQQNSDSDASVNNFDEFETEQYPCTRCKFVASNEEELNRHTQNNHSQTKNIFRRSSRRIYDSQTRLELSKARVKLNGKVYYQCIVCKLNLTSAYSYVSHKTIHSGKKLFACQICGRRFRLSGFLKKHLKHIHSMQGKQDDNPDVSNSDELQRKKRNYIDYKAIDKVRVVVNGSVFYKCEICNKKLTRLNYYLSHMTIHTGEKKFICHLCGKAFRLGAMLKMHVRLTHERIKNYACDVCNQKFGTSTNLSEHRRIHTGERPHVCAKCGKCFKQKSALYVHNRSHTDHFPFQCIHCDSKFRIQSQLNYHMIKHTGERPFSCEVCGKGFAIKSHLNRHMKNHVEGRPYPCTECPKDFRHKKNLISHMKNCHKI